MTKKILIDASHDVERRIAVVGENNKLDEFEFESQNKENLKGNIYLAKVTRVEPSLQAAFVDYGGNRHGFLAFSEIHPDYYQIPVSDREALEAELAEAQRLRAEELEEMIDEDSPSKSTSPKKPASSKKAATRRGKSKKSDVIVSDASEKSDDAVEIDLDIEMGDDVISESDVVSDKTAAKKTKASGNGDVQATSEATSETDTASTAPAAPEGEGSNVVLLDDGVDLGDIQTFGGITDEDAEADDEGSSVDRKKRLDITKRYKIQEVIKRNQIMLIQISKEERGNKGAALTTYLSLAGRYSVFMPNTANAGGISRKITAQKDRKRLREVIKGLDTEGKKSLIIRTAGQERTKLEIKRDYDYLTRTWDKIRENTINSIAPACVYEEGDIILRTIRDLYSKDISEVFVEGENGYKDAKTFMKNLMPSHAKRVQHYKEEAPSLFRKYSIETQIEELQSPVAHLPSGGSLVINPTEALVAIDINSGKATKERDIDDTAYKTNMEAAVEIARQLKLRDLAGLVVIDFIDMDVSKHVAAVERKLKEALKPDRARIQVGRISQFGLLELSRQRLRPSIIETLTNSCKHCAGTGYVRSIESTSLAIFRSIEEKMMKNAANLSISLPEELCLHFVNHKRDDIKELEIQYGIKVSFNIDSTLKDDDFKVDALRRVNSSRNDRKKDRRKTNKSQNTHKPNQSGNKGTAQNTTQKSHSNQASSSNQKSTSTQAGDANVNADDETKPNSNTPLKKRRRRIRRGRKTEDGVRVESVDAQENPQSASTQSQQDKPSVNSETPKAQPQGGIQGERTTEGSAEGQNQSKSSNNRRRRSGQNRSRNNKGPRNDHAKGEGKTEANSEGKSEGSEPKKVASVSGQSTPEKSASKPKESKAPQPQKPPQKPESNSNRESQKKGWWQKLLT